MKNNRIMVRFSDFELSLLNKCMINKGKMIKNILKGNYLMEYTHYKTRKPREIVSTFKISDTDLVKLQEIAMINKRKNSTMLRDIILYHKIKGTYDEN